jgi:hypothetical protein
MTVNQNYGKNFNISLANILHGPSVVGLMEDTRSCELGACRHRIARVWEYWEAG